MTITEAFGSGLRNSYRARKYILLFFGLNLALAIIPGSFIARSIQNSLGKSAASEKLLKGFDDNWYHSFSAQASGVTATIGPSNVGIGAVLDGLDDFLRGKLFNAAAPLAAGGVFYMVVALFLCGGLISVFTGAPGSFMDGAGRHFFRLLLLTLISGIIYGLIFLVVYPALGKAVDALTRETIDERAAFALTAVKYLIILLLAWRVNLIFDFAKIITIHHDVSAGRIWLAPLQAARMTMHYPGRTHGLYLLIGLLWVGLLLLYWLVAPGAGQSSWIGIMGAALIGQLYMLARLFIKGVFWAGESALYLSLSAADQG